MRKTLMAILFGLMVSFYFYPVTFKIMAAMNMKKLFAAVGVTMFGMKCIHDGQNFISKNIVVSFLICLLFSLLCYMSTVVNGVTDDAYTQYFMSFLVWTFGAYFLVVCMKEYYGTLDLRIIVHYLAAVSTFQCIIAQLIDTVPWLCNLVDSVIEQGQDSLREINRIYGLGASLDSGGVRLAISLVMIAWLIDRLGSESGHQKEIVLLYAEFIVITIFGNMIARTVTVGTAIGLGYLMMKAALRVDISVRVSRLRSLGAIVLMLAAVIPLFAYLYSSNADMNHQLRFAFEGFFNFVETGEFSTGSTDKLNATMWRWPETDREWLIGTGVFGNWAYGTDIGYCRFTLYCGLLGLSVFAVFFYHCAVCAAKKFEGFALCSMCLFALQLIVWLKVATDIYQIYALLFCIDAVSDKKQG